MSERSNVLYNFAQFKLIAPETVKKCQSINNEEKTGQTICLDKYNSRDFSNIINTTNTLKASNCMKMKENENLKNNLNILVEKNKLEFLNIYEKMTVNTQHETFNKNP